MANNFNYLDKYKSELQTYGCSTFRKLADPKGGTVFYSEHLFKKFGIYIDVEGCFGCKVKNGNKTTITSFEVENNDWDKAFLGLKEFLQEQNLID